MADALDQLQEALQYRFGDRALLQRALSHSSYVNEQPQTQRSNERLEFLGDSVLGFVAAEYFFRHHMDVPEGDLTKLRAAAVCETALCAYARTLDVGKYLMLGRGEEVTGGRERPSILADAFEALIAAIYLDGGMEKAQQFVLRFISKAPHKDSQFHDYKTTLQEIIQRNPEEKLEYVLVQESGPAHDRYFSVELRLNSNVIGHGAGRSKKLAEQAAAKEALELMGIAAN